MAVNLTGMLSQINQQMAPRQAAPQIPVEQQNLMQRVGVTDPLLQQFGMGLGGMLGTDMRSPAAIQQEQQQAQKDQTGSLLSRVMQEKDPAVLRSIASELAKTDPTMAVKVLEMAKGLEASTETLQGRDRYVSVGNKVFDMQTNSWNSPPTETEMQQLTPTEAAKLYKEYTTESVQAFIKDPSQPLVLKEQAEEETDEEMTQDKIAAQLVSSDALISKIDKALETADEVYGGTYDVAQFIPLTDARSLRGLLKTIEANLAFDRLQKMRDESKTGGALGQVSNIELELLKSSVASLDPASDLFIENLKAVKKHYAGFRRAILGEVPDSEQYKKIEGKLYYKDPQKNKWYDLGALQ